MTTISAWQQTEIPLNAKGEYAHPYTDVDAHYHIIDPRTGAILGQGEGHGDFHIPGDGPRVIIYADFEPL